jgi:hypothetical protein
VLKIKSQLRIDKNSDGFYIEGIHSCADDYIARLCGIDEKTYKEIMLTQYNAIPFINTTDFVYFKKYNDVKEAIKWVNSMILMQKLIT